MNSQLVTYKCEVCGHENRWTRNEILHLGEQMIYKGQYVYHEYSMPCQNPARPRCDERHVVDVPIWEE